MADRASPEPSARGRGEVGRAARPRRAVMTERSSVQQAQSAHLARPVVACDDVDVFGAPFYVMERVDGRPIREAVPDGWALAPDSHGRALDELIDALVAIHDVDWRACGLGDMAPSGDYLSRQ